ncbi:ribonuclease H1-like [Diachasma alloeum]|uniref:ribonuclease H1-like n=1 Tax=Diachasma alloeum TaxID=454923 RepID=UPI0007382E46|nr:ribonuclease H1-like [Diachasma alloeum]
MTSNTSIRIPVYVDGSYLYNGTDNAIAGSGIWFAHQHPLNTYKAVKGIRVTNITAENLAAIEACKICLQHDINAIKIITDSKYLISCMTGHMDKWKTYGWLNAKAKPVVNRDLLQQLDGLMQQIDVEFEFSPGHRGIYGNEKADELAKIGSKINPIGSQHSRAAKNYPITYNH